ncbi:homoserine O-acetyltransferase [Litorilinea aerophila]|uniref:Homoserine O-acetyltransferase n=1 Tax=Litorilinea aerophila TaxID=1204385 RepID=A0A540VLD3_9CHLR|nr:homoserine O-acetyltransferase [Litorilinea aerophila]MCC9074787.1 homoserine O-acetyltransferase [Litorilinea aerophila]
MNQIDLANSVGIVTPQSFTFAEDEPFQLESGATLSPVTIAYETYGRLNADRSNAILIVHALSGSAHAAGYHSPDDPKPGWWDDCIGPGKAFDTNRFFVICSNVIGSCYGSTGPASINPATGKPYGLNFPVVTIGDMVRAQVRLIDHLGIDQLLCVAGGSMGGMQVLEWAAHHPTRLKAAIALATTAHHSPMQIAFSEVGRQAIYADPNWNNGNYYESGKKPDAGLAVARMVGHITYLSEESMQKKFGRRLQGLERYGYEFQTEFEVESYLKYNGNNFTRRFDANSYLYITKAMDYFDLSKPTGSLAASFANSAHLKYLVISFTSDWLYPSYHSKQLVSALTAVGADVTYVDLQSSWGHDAFLLEVETMTRLIHSFLDRLVREEQVAPPDEGSAVAAAPAAPSGQPAVGVTR